jgi:arsenate reductase
MTTIYGIANCDTMKKAMTWLTENNIDFEFHNYKKQGISKEKVRQWISQQPLDKLINKAGQTYKKLAEYELPKSEAEAIALMMEKTSVIKRPIIEQDGQVVALGFDAINYQAIFG